MNKSLSASSSSTVSNGQQSLPISVPHPSSLPVQHPTMKPKRTRRTVNPKRPNAGRSSKYRGVTKHRWTGRFEAHLWDKNSCNNQKKKGKQVYLGAYDDEVAAAHTYDLAALKFWGRDTILNFAVENYERQYEAMQKVTREEFLSSLRRLSSGFARGQSRYRGVARHHHNGRWEARIGRVYGNKYLYLGTYKTQEEAAMAYDRAALMYRGANAITNFDIANYLHLPELQQLDLPPPPQQPNDSLPPPAPQTPTQAAEPFRPPSPSSTFQNLSILNGGSQEVIGSSDFISTSEFLEPEVQSAELVDPAISSDFISTSELFEPVQSAEFVDPAMGYDDSWNLCLDPAFDPLLIPDGISEIPSTFMDLLNDNAFDVDVDYDFTEEAVEGNDWAQFLNESDGLDEAMVDQGGALVEPVDTMSPATSAAASAVLAPGPGPFGCAYPMDMYS